MDIDRLQAIIASKIANGVLALDAAALESDEVSSLLGEFLVEGKLVVTLDPGQAPQVEGTAIALSGVGAAAPFSNMTISVVFSVVSQKAEVSVTAHPYDGWSFPDSFPAWSSRFFPALRFKAQPVFHLCTSGAVPGETAGLHFRGDLDTSAVLGPFAFLLGDQSPRELHGDVTSSAGTPLMLLSTDPAPGPRLGFFALDAVALEVATNADVVRAPRAEIPRRP